MMKSIQNIKLLFYVLCSLIMISAPTYAQKEKLLILSAKVVDADNNPLSGVLVLSAKGLRTSTNADGEFSFQVPTGSGVVLEKEGYESQLFQSVDIMPIIELQKVALFQGESNTISTGFSSVEQCHIVNAISSVKPSQFLTYDNTMWAPNAIDGKVLGMKGSNNIRGVADALVVIDGIPGRNIGQLNVTEIEEITVLKDANAAILYGSEGANGVILVTTKKGKAYKKQANISVNYTYKDPISYPEYMDAVEYMGAYSQAYIDDGKVAPFSPEQIAHYDTSRYANPYSYPDVDLYAEDYLKAYTYSTNVTTEFSGGNDKVQYYVNLGWNKTASLVKINPEANVGSNRFNVRGNIDFEVSENIKSSTGVFTVISTNKSAHTSLLSSATTFRPHLYAPLLPVDMINVGENLEQQDILHAANKYDGQLLGTILAEQNNTPIANMIAGGYKDQRYTTTQFNNSIDFDMSPWVEGLSAQTYLSFDFYDSRTISINNKYSVYEPVWNGDTISAINKLGDEDLKDQTRNISTNSFSVRYGFFGKLNYEIQLNDNHYINAGLLAYTNSVLQRNQIQRNVNSHLGFNVNYNYKNKLFADFSSAYVHSIKLHPDNRNALSPSLGLAYLLSEELFMNDIDALDFLKLKGSIGTINTDLGINQYYLYQGIYVNDGWYGWNDEDNNQRTSRQRAMNPSLGFEKYASVNLGFELYMFHTLGMEFNAFRYDQKDKVTLRNTLYPSYYNTMSPYDNYNADRYEGLEFGINYSKHWGDFAMALSGNILYTHSEVMQRDELYNNDYQYRTGKSTDTRFGYVVADDKFYSDADFDPNGKLVSGTPVPLFGPVKPGDLRYEDLDNNGIIDSDDQKDIGRWSNPMAYNLNLNLSYKNFTLFVFGQGQSGGQSITSSNYYWVDGTMKYSAPMRGSWTLVDDKANATYPRLSPDNDTHNFKSSDFWTYDNSYFKLSRAQLTYELGEDFCQKLNMKDCSVYVAGANLLHLAENKEIRELSIGDNPQFRNYSIGLVCHF